jgi:hypothetical protein
VTFGADIAVDRFDPMLSQGGGDLTVNTAGFSLEIRERLSLCDKLYFVGEGVPKAVVRIVSGGALYVSDTSRDALPYITAMGAGGTALELTAGAALENYADAGFGARAMSAGGVAIRSETALVDARYELHGLLIEANAPGGRGVVSSAPIAMLLCRVTADAASAEAPELTLDTCAVSPAASGAAIIRRALKPSAAMKYQTGILPLGGAPPSVYRAVVTLDAPGEIVITAAFQTSFDTSWVNPAAVGVYPMPMRVPAPFDLAAHDFDDYTTEVFDPIVPRFCGAQMGGFPPPARYFLDYYYMGALADLVLWRSDDAGETWYAWWIGADADENGEVGDSPVRIEQDADAGMLFVTIRDPYTALAGEARLVFEALFAQKDSRVLVVRVGEGEPDDGVGGDRTGVDRVSDDGDVGRAPGGGNAGAPAGSIGESIVDEGADASDNRGGATDGADRADDNAGDGQSPILAEEALWDRAKEQRDEPVARTLDIQGDSVVTAPRAPLSRGTQTGAATEIESSGKPDVPSGAAARQGNPEADPPDNPEPPPSPVPRAEIPKNRDMAGLLWAAASVAFLCAGAYALLRIRAHRRNSP